MAPEAGPAASSATESVDPATPPLYFAVLFIASILGAAHGTFANLPWLYLERGASWPRFVPGLLGLLALCAGVVLTRRARTGSFVALSRWLSLGALAVGANAIAIFVAFGRGLSLGVVTSSGALLTGAALGAAAGVATRCLGPTLVRLDAPWRLANPFRLLALTALCGGAAALAAGVGALRAGLALGMVLAALALWAPALGWFLERRPMHGSRNAQALAVSLLLVSGTGFLAAEALLPRSELHAYPNPVVYYEATDRQRFSVTAGQDAFELRVDGKLKASTVDETRYFQALVQPALAVAPSRARVLLLGGGTGLAEREVLRHGDVASLTVVVIDRRLAELSTRLAWLSRRSGRALESERVELIEAEPIVWLGQTEEHFDVAIVDLSDPESYLEGKSYTRYFYQKLAARLAPGGVAAIQAASAFDAPEAFATVVQTLRAAGLTPRAYHAAVPTIGDWGFVLAFSGAPPERATLSRATPHLSGVTIDELGYVPRDMRGKPGARPNLLFDQHVVELYQDERAGASAP